jgi:SAM-dependent methyltransferase
VRTLAKDCVDTIVCANVLEHVEDDRLALTNMRAILRGGGRLLLLVPAHPFLFGTMDQADEHFRRYTRSTLTNRVRAAGFEVERLYQMNALGIVAWFVNGKLLRRRLIPSTQYGLYNRLVPTLARAERGILRPPVGLSLVCIARTSAIGDEYAEAEEARSCH